MTRRPARSDWWAVFSTVLVLATVPFTGVAGATCPPGTVVIEVDGPFDLDCAEPTPTVAPTPTPTQEPEPSPEPSPSPTPTAEPSETPSVPPEPTATVRPSPTVAPTPSPPTSPTPPATPTPTSSATPAPSPTATPQSTQTPTAEPTPPPTATPRDGITCAELRQHTPETWPVCRRELPATGADLGLVNLAVLLILAGCVSVAIARKIRQWDQEGRP